MANPSEGLLRLLETLDRLELPYAIGGSVASSAHGVPRSTMDVDVVVDLSADQVEELVEGLQPDFYAEAADMRSAIVAARSFNVIHMPSAYKFDIFPLKRDEYSQTEFGRRQFLQIQGFGPEPIECAVATAEDTILRKLEWYRKGGETSERQWSDLRGILTVSGAGLDREYLRKWAGFLRVEDLLDRLSEEGGFV